MKVIVDLDVCEGRGQSVAPTPEIFLRSDDADVVTVLQAEPPGKCAVLPRKPPGSVR